MLSFFCRSLTSPSTVRPRQATAPTYSKNAAPLDHPPLPRKNPRSAPGMHAPSVESIPFATFPRHRSACFGFPAHSRTVLSALTCPVSDREITHAAGPARDTLLVVRQSLHLGACAASQSLGPPWLVWQRRRNRGRCDLLGGGGDGSGSPNQPGSAGAGSRLRISEFFLERKDFLWPYDGWECFKADGRIKHPVQ